MKRVDSNDTGAMHLMGKCYYSGLLGLQQDETKAIELWIRAAEFGCSKAHNDLGMYYYHGENWKKASFTWRPQPWQDMKGQEAILDTLNFYSSTIQTELLSIGSLLHLLGHIWP